MNEYTVHGPLPREPGDLSRLLYQRYRDVLRGAGYPILRLEEMIYGSGHGPRPEDEVSESSYTIEWSFNTAASRSRDSSPEGESEQERLRRYQQSSLEEVSSPEFWQAVHHFQESDPKAVKNGHDENKKQKPDTLEKETTVDQG